MRFVASSIGGVVVAMALLHCSLTTDFDGLTGGSIDAAPAAEASIDASTARRTDAGLDASADADAAFSCPTDVAYCNDFSSGVPTDITQDVVVNGGGTFTIDNGSLHAVMPAHPEDGTYAATMFKVIGSGSARHAILDVDITFGETNWGDNGNVSILALNIDDDTFAAAELYVSPSFCGVTTTNPNQPGLIYDNTSADLPRGRPVHVTLDVDFAAHNGVVRLSFDGNVVTLHPGVDFPELAKDLRFVMGITRNNSPTPALDIRYDNVVVRTP